MAIETKHKVTFMNDAEWKELQKTSILVLIDFTAQWCGPCKRLSPILETLANKYPQVLFKKVDVDSEQSAELVSSFGVTAMPTVFIGLTSDASTDMKRLNGLQKEDSYDQVLQKVIGQNACS